MRGCSWPSDPRSHPLRTLIAKVTGSVGTVPPGQGCGQAPPVPPFFLPSSEEGPGHPPHCSFLSHSSLSRAPQGHLGVMATRAGSGYHGNRRPGRRAAWQQEPRLATFRPCGHQFWPRMDPAPLLHGRCRPQPLLPHQDTLSQGLLEQGYGSNTLRVPRLAGCWVQVQVQVHPAWGPRVQAKDPALGTEGPPCRKFSSPLLGTPTSPRLCAVP